MADNDILFDDNPIPGLEESASHMDMLIEQNPGLIPANDLANLNRMKEELRKSQLPVKDGQESQEDREEEGEQALAAELAKMGTQQPPAQPATEPAAKPETPATESLEEVVKKLQHSFSVLKGKYDAEVPLLHEQLREKEETIRQLTERAPRKPEEAKTEMATDPASYGLTEEEREYLQPAGINAALKIAKVIAAEQVKAFKTEIDQLRQQVGGVTEAAQQSKASQCQTIVMATHPDYVAMSSEPQFALWCQARDWRSGQTNGQLFDQANHRCDGESLVKFFDDYKSQYHPAPQTPPATAPAARPKPKVSLESQVMPAQRGGSSAPAADESIMTFAQYHDIQTRATKGEFGPLDEPEAQKILVALRKRLTEGRVR